jgi:hypothetical protein
MTILNSVPQVRALYSPDMTCCDSFCSLDLKKSLIGKIFYGVETSEYNATEQLLVILETDFQKSFQQWQECYKCVCGGQRLGGVSFLNLDFGFGHTHHSTFC